MKSNDNNPRPLPPRLTAPDFRLIIRGIEAARDGVLNAHDSNFGDEAQRHLAAVAGYRGQCGRPAFGRLGIVVADTAKDLWFSESTAWTIWREFNSQDRRQCLILLAAAQERVSIAAESAK